MSTPQFYVKYVNIVYLVHGAYNKEAIRVGALACFGTDPTKPASLRRINADCLFLDMLV